MLELVWVSLFEIYRVCGVLDEFDQSGAIVVPEQEDAPVPRVSPVEVAFLQQIGEFLVRDEVTVDHWPH